MSELPTWVDPLLYALIVILASAGSFLLGRVDRAYRRDKAKIQQSRATLEDMARKVGGWP